MLLSPIESTAAYFAWVQIRLHAMCAATVRKNSYTTHYTTTLAVLEQKPRALDQAASLQDWVLPEAFDRLRRLLEVRMERRGRKEYIQVLQLLENFSQVQVEQATRQAMVRGLSVRKAAISCGVTKNTSFNRPLKKPLSRVKFDAPPHFINYARN